MPGGLPSPAGTTAGRLDLPSLCHQSRLELIDPNLSRLSKMSVPWKNVNGIGFSYTLSFGNVNEEMILVQHRCVFGFFKSASE